MLHKDQTEFWQRWCSRWRPFHCADAQAARCVKNNKILRGISFLFIAIKMPGTRCCVNVCPSRGKLGKNEKFFRVPTAKSYRDVHEKKMLHRRRVWLALAGVENCDDFKVFYICSRHFITGIITFCILHWLILNHTLFQAHLAIYIMLMTQTGPHHFIWGQVYVKQQLVIKCMLNI